MTSSWVTTGAAPDSLFGHHHVVAFEVHLVDRHRLGGRQRLRLAVQKREGAAVLPALDRALLLVDVALGQRAPGRDCSGRRWQRTRPRCEPGTLRPGRLPAESPSLAPPWRRVSGPVRSCRRLLAGTTRSPLRPPAWRPGRPAAALITGGSGICSRTSSRKPRAIEPVRHRRRHSPALEVETLVLGNGTDRRGVAATNVVVLDLEIGDRVGVGAFVQHQVPIGLEGVGSPRSLVHPDETAVDRPGPVGDHSLVQKLGLGLGCPDDAGRCGSRASGIRHRSTGPRAARRPPEPTSAESVRRRA